MQTKLTLTGKISKSNTSERSSKPYSRPVSKSKPGPRGTGSSSSKYKERTFNRDSLKDPNDPITHSTAYERAFHYVSGASGHQQSNGRSSTVMSSWNQHRNAKLSFQAEKAETSIFARCVCYLNGFQGEDEGNLHIKRLIQLGGGQVVTAFSRTRVTHIVTASGLSGKKVQDEIDAKSNSVRVVHPDWVITSSKAGVRKPESSFPVLGHETQKSVKSYAAPESSKTSTAKEDVPPPRADRIAMDDWEWLEAREERKRLKREEAERNALTSAQRC